MNGCSLIPAAEPIRMIESPECADTVVDGLAHAVNVTGVDRGGDDAAACGLDEAGRLVQILLCRRGIGSAHGEPSRDIDRDDVGAFGGHPDGVCTSLPPGRSGDEGDLAGEPFAHACAAFTRLPPMISR
jgi:hypothetical protein